MRRLNRRGMFLILAGTLALLALGIGVWLFWLSGARQLLLCGGLMLALTLGTWWLWRGLPADAPAESREAAAPDGGSAP